MKKVVLLLLAVSLPALVAAQGANSDAFQGTWKLDVAKSHFTPGPAPKGETLTIGSGHVSVHSVINTPGGERTVDWSYTPGTEGRPVPITGMPNCTITSKRTNDRTIEHTFNFYGQILHGRGVVSKDGKTLRYTVTGKARNGETVHNVEIFEKQSS